jgi:hypothetical protein
VTCSLSARHSSLAIPSDALWTLDPGSQHDLLTGGGKGGESFPVCFCCSLHQERFCKSMTGWREPQRNYRPYHPAISTPLDPQVTVTTASDQSLIAQVEKMKLELRIFVG